MSRCIARETALDAREFDLSEKEMNLDWEECQFRSC